LLTTSTTGTGAINLTGNALAQSITGNAGINRLEDGLGAADTLTGGAGNDTYVVRNSGSLIVEGLGGGTADAVFANVSFVLAADDNIELLATLSVAGTTAIDLTGNSLSQRIFGNAAANRLESGAGAADTLTGGGGNDTYFVRNAATLIVENTGGGTLDTVGTSVSFTLAADDNIEILTAIPAAGITPINLTGNALVQSIIGNAGANRIDGKGGKDVLNGGAGADVFVFTSTLGAGNVDRIQSYAVGSDQIEIDNAVFTGMVDNNALLAASAFTFNTTGLATAVTHRIIYDTDSGFLWFDRDGTGAVAAIHFATVDIGVALAASEFTVI
jgi:Ca2+-binding RTX toxin-like protein